LPRTGHDDAAHVIVRAEVSPQLPEFFPHDGIERVERLGSIQRDPGNAVLLAVVNRREVHGSSSGAFVGEAQIWCGEHRSEGEPFGLSHGTNGAASIDEGDEEHGLGASFDDAVGSF